MSRLRRFLTAVRSSSWYETAPVDVPDHQPKFLNGAVVGETALSAHDVLAELMAIERERGRERPFPNAARTLDLDLVLFGDQRINQTQLVVPHPRFRERQFVLEPLAEIAPELRDPVTGLTIAEILSRLRGVRP